MKNDAPKIKEKIRTKYVNPLTDFGFKLLFGIKEAMLNFLNSILEIEGGIIDLTYDNVEIPPHSEEERKASFDLHCTTGTGEQLIIEMQNRSQPFYKDRTLYYASFKIQAEAPIGKDWNFQLPPIYSVNIVNFKLKTIGQIELPKPKKSRKENEPEKKYVTTAQLFDKDTKELFYDKLTFIYLELPNFNKKEDELKTDTDKWMYVLKNLSKLDALPESLQNEMFEKVFQAAEIAKMTKKAKNNYYNSLKHYRDMNNYVIQHIQAVAEAKKETEVYRQENAMFRQDIAMFRQENDMFRQDIAESRQRERILQQEIAELNRQLYLKNNNLNN
jgi:predicted transposase/invertase (TIGR01784 family)